MSRNSRGTYHNSRRRRQNIKVYGEQRENIDVHLLAQAVIALGHQMHQEAEFFIWLAEQDSRVTTDRQPGERYLAVAVDDLDFALFDGGHLVCCLPADERQAALQLPGARRWAPGDGERIYEEWVRLPDGASRTIWQQYGLAALRYAIACLESTGE